MSRQEDVWEKVEKLYEAIYEGNGEPSMKVQLATIHERLDSCPVGAKNKADIKWMWVCGTMALTGIIGAMAWLHK